MAESASPPKKPAMAPERHADEGADQHDDDGDGNGMGSAIEGAGEDVAPEPVGAEPMLGAGRLQSLAHEIQGIVGRPILHRGRGDDPGEDDDGAQDHRPGQPFMAPDAPHAGNGSRRRIGDGDHAHASLIFGSTTT